jgi:hypothetical protein
MTDTAETITLRVYIATEAMNATIIATKGSDGPERTAAYAVMYADALIKELSK